MNAVLQEILDTGHARAADGRPVPVHSGISAEEGCFLQAILKELRPEATLEVGLAFGVSALFICDALAEIGTIRHTCIDPNQHGGRWGDSWNGLGIENLRRAGFADGVRLIEAPSYEALPRLLAEGRRYDFALIDGWHTFDYALVDFFYIDLMLRPGGVVALDDADWPGVTTLCRYILTNRAYSVHGTLPAGASGDGSRASWVARALSRAGWASRRSPASCVALRKERDDGRSWDFHRPF